jgi:glycosyltransferase involved in cell wall biosynthesis
LSSSEKAMTELVQDISICAIITVRNEADYLTYLLPRLASERIDAAVIDHQSSDDTLDIVQRHRGSPVIEISTLPYLGFFSLTQQLEHKRALIEGLRHDWLVHLDADEILEHREPGKTLRDVIEDAEALGCNVVNFEEFTFIPEPGKDYAGCDYVAMMRRYYFFQIRKNWMHRAWKRESGLDNVSGAGHTLRGEGIRLSPYTHVMRHYIGLSQAHIWDKYLHRVFDPGEISRGWHRDRKQLTREELRLPGSSPHLQRLDDGPKACLCRTSPASSHFWYW